MEYYSLIRNENVIIVEEHDLSIEYLSDHRNRTNAYIYVENKRGIKGIIGRREIYESLKNGSVVINRNFAYCTDESEGTARTAFGIEPSIRVLPVIINGRVLFEWQWSREKFFDDLLISKGVNQEERNEGIVVSLTTHGKRRELVYLAIKSVMHQTMKADAVVLYLDDESGDAPINKEEELVDAGLIIKRHKRNLRPHCKYYYAMNDYPNSIIITIDDDILYPDNIIEDLYKKHLEYPDAVIARRAHKVTDGNGIALKVADYGWEQSSDRPEKFFCATGVGGILYPVGDYRNYFLDENTIMECSLNNDDIWLMYQEARIKKKVFAMKSLPLRIIAGSQEEEGLTVRNDGMEENQIWIEKLEQYYGRTMQELLDENWELRD